MIPVASIGHCSSGERSRCPGQPGLSPASSLLPASLPVGLVTVPVSGHLGDFKTSSSTGCRVAMTTESPGGPTSGLVQWSDEPIMRMAESAVMTSEGVMVGRIRENQTFGRQDRLKRKLEAEDADGHSRGPVGLDADTIALTADWPTTWQAEMPQPQDGLKEEIPLLHKFNKVSVSPALGY
ncbi:unnamed protein product [Protopolystoma xenopodis]|uniref:Uncharacterized protein n=1 Tax=Protopolystoma xenopodis TaxID=117903 RepID=A0A448X1T8_9PLAT|nr:unnamed protein product [Protopolystoma xenopodis]